MAYDEELADRIRTQLADEFDVVEKRMFGGLAFLVRGHLTVGASRTGGLLARTEPEVEDQTLTRPGVSPMSPGPRRMPGWVVVDAAQIADDADLARWIDESLDFVAGLSPKA